MKEFLRCAFLPAVSIESTGYSAYSVSGVVVARDTAERSRGRGEESRCNEGLAAGTIRSTNSEALKVSKYGDESRYGQQKVSAVSVSAVQEPLPLQEAVLAGGGSQVRAQEREDQSAEVVAVIGESEVRAPLPLPLPQSQTDAQAGVDPRSLMRDQERSGEGILPQTLDLDQMVASYLSMHRLPQSGDKKGPQPVARLRPAPAVITPSHVTDNPRSQGRGDVGMSEVGEVEDSRRRPNEDDGRSEIGQAAQVSEQSERLKDAAVDVDSGPAVTARGVPQSRRKDETARGQSSGQVSHYFAAASLPSALTSMVTPRKDEAEGRVEDEAEGRVEDEAEGRVEDEREVQDSDGRERDVHMGVPANSSRFSGLCILVSEAFMELSDGSWAITILAENYGISCTDTLLQAPVTAIVDGSTAVCVVEEGVVGEVSSLKGFVKQLTSLVHCFSCIWIIIISRRGDDDEETARRGGQEGAVEAGMGNLCTAISRFPVRVVVRSIAESTSTALQPATDKDADAAIKTGTGTGTTVGAQLAEMIHLVCNDTANSVCIAQNILRERFVSREFLTALQGNGSFAFAEQCDFLQLFASLNFYTAAQILSILSLKQIAEHLPERASVLKQALQFVPPIDAACLDSAFALFTVHCGLQRSTGRGAVAVAAI